MSRIVFLVEEPSMKRLLEGLLPRLFPGLPFLCIPHEGKRDLEKSIPRKLRAWNEQGVQFCILWDNDGACCKSVKQHLVDLCASAGRKDARVRIVCQELEAWYFGCPEVLARVYGDDSLGHLSVKARFRDPDAIDHPSRVLRDLVPEFQKLSGANRMSAAMTERNSSRSFQVFLQAVEDFRVQFGASNPSPEET